MTRKKSNNNSVTTYNVPTIELFGIEDDLTRTNVLARIVMGLRAAGLDVKFEHVELQSKINNYIASAKFTNDPTFCSPVLLINTWYRESVKTNLPDTANSNTAVVMGRAGGIARAQKLSKKEKSDIAKLGAQKRWKK